MTDIVAMALDQSPNNTGWAIGRPREKRPIYGKFGLPSWGHDEPARIAAFRDFLVDALTRHGVTHLFYELDVPAAGKGFAQIYTPKGGRYAGQTRARVVNSKDPAITRNQDAMTTVIWLVAHDKRIPVRPIDVGDMRERFIGCRSVPGLQGDAHRAELKKRALRACAMRGWLVEDDNVAEALGHLDFGLSSLDPKGHAFLDANTHARRAELNLWNGGT